jgi:hypothetical protein
MEYHSVMRSYPRPGESGPHLEQAAPDGERTDALGAGIVLFLAGVFRSLFDCPSSARGCVSAPCTAGWIRILEKKDARAGGQKTVTLFQDPIHAAEKKPRPRFHFAGRYR